MQVLGLSTLLLLVLRADALRLRRLCFTTYSPEREHKSLLQLFSKQLHQQYLSYRLRSRSQLASSGPSSVFLAPSHPVALPPSPVLESPLAPAPLRVDFELMEMATTTSHQIHCEYEDTSSATLWLLIVLPPFLAPWSLLP